MTRSIAPAKWLPRARPYLFLLPMLLFAVGFVYYPFLKTALHSITVVNAQGRILDFAGLENFRSLFARPIFSTALLNSLRLTALNVPITVALTLSLALLAQKKRRFGASYEILFSLPMALSMSMAALIFKVLLHPTVGYVNYALGLDIGWFTDRGAAMLGILQVTIWMGVGFNFLLFLVALRGMPESLIEAATMDGAGALTRLFRIKLPLLTPTIFYVALTNMVLALMTSGPVMIITQGGPSRATTTLIYLMYTSGYGSSNYSLAACVSLITFAFAFAMTLLAFAFERRGVHYDE